MLWHAGLPLSSSKGIPPRWCRCRLLTRSDGTRTASGSSDKTVRICGMEEKVGGRESSQKATPAGSNWLHFLRMGRLKWSVLGSDVGTTNLRVGGISQARGLRSAHGGLSTPAERTTVRVWDTATWSVVVIGNPLTGHTWQPIRSVHSPKTA